MWWFCGSCLASQEFSLVWSNILFFLCRFGGFLNCSVKQSHVFVVPIFLWARHWNLCWWGEASMCRRWRCCWLSLALPEGFCCQLSQCLGLSECPGGKRAAVVVIPVRFRGRSYVVPGSSVTHSDVPCIYLRDALGLQRHLQPAGWSPRWLQEDYRWREWNPDPLKAGISMCA